MPCSSAAWPSAIWRSSASVWPVGLSGEVITMPAIWRPPFRWQNATASAMPSSVYCQADASSPGASSTFAPTAYGPQL